MSEENRNREETPGRQKISRDENKSGVDKLIDKAQEKGVFDKAAKFARDKFGGGRRR
ncbi:MAG: hypothetical protein ACRDSJ_21155 [Rubrobacteraceae bacterium]